MTRWPALAALGGYAALSAYFRYRPQPEGINGEDRTYHVPSESVHFFHDTSWYEADERHTIRQITDRVLHIIREARSFVLLDVFLFNLHHVSGQEFIPTTRQITDAIGQKDIPVYFITDPLNTSYGTEDSEPIRWLQESGASICFTDLSKLRDNNMVYAPLWRLVLQHLDNGDVVTVRNPLRQDESATVRAVLQGLTAKGNHRKLVIADQAGSYVTLLTSSNFEDASSYFVNTAIEVRSQAVARHFLEAEKAVARMSGMAIPVTIPPTCEDGDALVTPLMGNQIKRALLDDVHHAAPGDELYVLVLFLADRDCIEALIDASLRGVSVTVILDRNKVSFGEPKEGFPNQIVAAELIARSNTVVRWAHTRDEEFHSKFVLLRKRDRCILHAGSANLTQRSLSNTNLEANIRVEAPSHARVCRDALHYVRWIAEAPRSIESEHGDGSALHYWGYRLQEATGTATW